jgi:signal transduction histidine kinase
MHVDPQASPDGPAACDRLEGDALRTLCDRQSVAIEELTEEVARLRAAADGIELRAEVRLAIDSGAPAAARAAITRLLHGEAAPTMLASAQLIASELVTNSVRHSGASPDEALVLRVELALTTLWLEVEDPGQGGSVAPRNPDPDGGGGMGLNLVRTISERWGVEQIGVGGTRVWAQLPRAADRARAG